MCSIVGSAQFRLSFAKRWLHTYIHTYIQTKITFILGKVSVAKHIFCSSISVSLWHWDAVSFKPWKFDLSLATLHYTSLTTPTLNQHSCPPHHLQPGHWVHPWLGSSYWWTGTVGFPGSKSRPALGLGDKTAFNKGVHSTGESWGLFNPLLPLTWPCLNKTHTQSQRGG